MGLAVLWWIGVRHGCESVSLSLVISRRHATLDLTMRCLAGIVGFVADDRGGRTWLWLGVGGAWSCCWALDFGFVSVINP